MVIPKHIFQVNKFTNPQFIINQINKYSNNWEYVCFKESSIIEYTTYNCIDELNITPDIIQKIEKSIYKKEFFIYYYLYLNGGVYISENIMLESDINVILTDSSYCFVKSCITELLFDGFIATIPKNPIILNFLINFLQLIINNNYNDYTIIKNEFYNQMLSLINDNELLYEKINTQNCKIFNKNNILVITHYYHIDLNNDKHIYYSKNIVRNFNKSINEIKIGISLNIPLKPIDLYSNGIRQNILYLAELLLNIGYKCNFIVFDDELKNVSKSDFECIMYDDRFNITKYSDIFFEDFDIIIIMGTTLHIETIKVLKHLNTIIIGYFCGNSYIIDSENILHKPNIQSNIQYCLEYNNETLPIYDEIWSIPQMVNTNINYWKTLYRTNCIEVPFIWSPKSIEISQKIGNVNEDYFLYDIKKANINKSIVICEPNISIMKWCLPCVLICENAYRKINNKNKLQHIYITNLISKDNFNIELFNKHISSLDVFKDKKLSKEHRFNILNFIKNHADICVSHTWENGLNYLYFDLAWMGWPIIHNGHLCKDIGYYYDNFNYELGGNILIDVIKNHDKNSKLYIENNRKNIDRYLPSNKDLQNKYEALITNLINTYKYNFNMNTNIDYKYLTTKTLTPIIPLVIYQVWHSDTLPESVNHSIETIKHSNPEFEHKLFNLELCREFIKNNFEERILNAFDNIIPYVCKFDLWRYCILYLNGGIYLDPKYSPINNFKFYWLTDKEYFCRDITTSDSGIYNALIICKPKNILMLNAINKLVENIENKYYGTFSLEPTGPVMLKNIAIEIDMNIHTFELYLEKVNDIEHYIHYKSIRILDMNKKYRLEQPNYSKHWSHYWLNKCMYK